MVSFCSCSSPPTVPGQNGKGFSASAQRQMDEMLFAVLKAKRLYEDD